MEKEGTERGAIAQLGLRTLQDCTSKVCVWGEGHVKRASSKSVAGGTSASRRVSVAQRSLP